MPEFEKSAKIRQSYHEKIDASFFRDSVYSMLMMEFWWTKYSDQECH